LTDDGQWNSDLDAAGWNFTVMKIQISFWSGIDIVKIWTAWLAPIPLLVLRTRTVTSLAVGQCSRAKSIRSASLSKVLPRGQFEPNPIKETYPNSFLASPFGFTISLSYESPLH
jgi:hypothetical protein